MYSEILEMTKRRRIATTYRLDSWVTDQLVDLANEAGESVNAYVEKVLFKHCIDNLPKDDKVEPLGDQRRRASKRGLKLVEDEE
ncbi:hypothetical protein [aff. Roholtiella sp. LEGE 12411]|uniref:hypothetical protein n=1 Tax=aff. Roholtiella sp. LEGE 12411 TaxID=1828822 RepID=UPI0018820959|nr:hypothetical protein [aff. Roholtiella sp. LEGE 12411]MBE9038604.1 hypothetical protein [aff. Roholtiella sp. LEGE 12411]